MSVYGHDQARARFLSALGRGRLHHAWLLHGPSGIGKALLAFEMARDYLCEKNHGDGQAAPACGECHACKMMAAGSHPDFMRVEREWDEKKKMQKRDVSIAQVRALLSFLALSGAESERRVVLLDEAERMNLQAANALLKGLEEPSPGSLLLLVSERLSALPATVRSRCLLLALHPLPQEVCRRALLRMGIGKEVLDFAARLADGRPGRVRALADSDRAAALAEWEALTRDPGGMDIGAVSKWIDRHVRSVPHALIVEVVLQHLRTQLYARGDFHAREALLDAAWRLAAWPAETQRRSLRPAPTLLAHMLALHMARREFAAEASGA